MSLFPDLIDLCAAFDAAGAEYLLVGGHAVAIHGRPRFTRDADIWVSDTPENLSRVRAALTEFGAPPNTADLLERAAPEDVVYMGQPPTRIDLVTWVPGGDFARAWRGRTTRTFDGVPVRLVDVDTLIELKEASGRPIDLEDARALRARAR